MFQAFTNCVSLGETTSMKSLSLNVFLILILTACASNVVPTPIQETSIETPTSVSTSSEDAVQSVIAPSEMSSISTEAPIPTVVQQVNAAQIAPINLPTWQTLPLTNARTGETFTFADFAGKTVFVEPMATWCPNCRQQLGNVSSIHTQLDAAQFVFISVSVETNITSADLAQYAEDNGFDWMFAVLTPELLGELTATFGRTITNPPSTPHFIIRPDGTTTGLTTGIESGSQLVEQLMAASGG
jgi:cytochrome oxidase Cu insertion factor (SCO1/SenC/PrrC family)